MHCFMIEIIQLEIELVSKLQSWFYTTELKGARQKIKFAEVSAKGEGGGRPPICKKEIAFFVLEYACFKNIFLTNIYKIINI